MNNMRLVIGVQASFIPISSSHRGGLFQNGLYPEYLPKQCMPEELFKDLEPQDRKR